MFDPFFTTKEVGKGSGLGLSQVHGFAHASGGFVAIESPPEQGTTVRIYLPRARADVNIARMPTVAVAKPWHAARGRTAATVLIVDDNDEVRDVVAECVEAAGYNVLAANSAAEALTISRGNIAVDVLFSDIIMPGGMTGEHLAREARLLRPNIGVLLTTGYANAAVTTQPCRDCEEAILAKPYRPEEVVRRSAALLPISRDAPP